MNYLEIIKQSLDYIEENLEVNIKGKDISDRFYLSMHHYSRIFSSIVGIPLMEYVRGRKLSKSLEIIENSDRKLLEIAFLYGFESQESYTKAFKKSFGITPGKFRKDGGVVKKLEKFDIYLKKIELKNLKGGFKMKPKIVEFGPVKLVGMKDVITSNNNTIPQLWMKFMGRRGEIENSTNRCFGVAQELVEFDGGYEFTEIAAAEVIEFPEQLPENMVTKEIPKMRYMVVTHKGKIFENGESYLQKTYDYLYGNILPKFNYEVSKDFNFELYDERFNPESDNSEMDIYIPIK